MDNRVIIKRFLLASADSKVCIEYLDTFLSNSKALSLTGKIAPPKSALLIGVALRTNRNQITPA